VLDQEGSQDALHVIYTTMRRGALPDDIDGIVRIEKMHASAGSKWGGVATPQPLAAI
jgi:hypothetical protein